MSTCDPLMLHGTNQHHHVFIIKYASLTLIYISISISEYPHVNVNHSLDTSQRPD